MKIAIQGHPTRGKEVIQIIESFGGKKLYYSNAFDKYLVFFIDDKGYISCFHHESPLVKEYFKIYTLEEFEKEFPFKVGDKVTFLEDNYPYTIKSFNIWSDGDIVCEFKETGMHYSLSKLKLYKEMKEERNITLTLDKAKEWYKKGGELKEIALQAFSEKELTKIDLPKTWKEFCENYPVQKGETIIDGQTSEIRRYYDVAARSLTQDKNICPSKKSAEAHLAMIQLEQLRNCWWNGWEPEWSNCEKYVIKWDKNDLMVFTARNIHAFLVFPTREMAEEFLMCFRDLIEKAGDLI